MATDRCIFCGKRPVTDEHLISQWASAVLDEDPRPVQQPAGIHRRYTRHLGKESRKEWRNDRRAEFVAKCVCADCNAGWMGLVETRARPFLEPMIRGASVNLHAEACEAPATWLALKSIIERYTQSPVVPVEQAILREFYALRRPPLHWHIWVTRYVGTQRAGFACDLRLIARTFGTHGISRSAYRMLVTAVIGYFGGQVFAPEKQLALKQERRQHQAIWIWPPEWQSLGGTHSWPPAGFLNDESLEAISEMRTNGLPR
jgi:hypothetical protein